MSRFALPSSLPDLTIFSFRKPIRLWVRGTLTELTCLAARLACLALAANEVQGLIKCVTMCALVQNRIDIEPPDFRASMDFPWISMDSIVKEFP